MFNDETAPATYVPIYHGWPSYTYIMVPVFSRVESLTFKRI